VALTYVTKSEFQGKFATVQEQINALQNALYGKDPNYPISLSDLGSDVVSALDKTSYLKRGEAIPSSQLPLKSQGTYIDQRTQGVINWSVTAPSIIDEVVNARDGELSLDARLDDLTVSDDIIAAINASTEATKISKTQIQVSTIDHNELDDRDVSDCHPQSAITDLVSDLSDKTDSATIIATINASVEVALIDPAHIDVASIDHGDLDGLSDADSHPISAITGLEGRLSAAEDDATAALGAIDAALVAAGYTPGVDTLSDFFQCIIAYFNTVDPGGATRPACATTWTMP
jgi:hypothetical protein